MVTSPIASSELYKVVWVDGYNRDAVADRLVKDSLTAEDANTLCENLRKDSTYEGNWWVVRKQDAALWGGLKEFV